MSNKKTLKRKINSFLYDHIWLKYLIEYGVAFIMSVISAAIFAFGIVCFMRPGLELEGITDLVSGGSSGLAQTVALALEMCGVQLNGGSSNLLFSICYLAINIPLIVLAFIGIGKRFAIFTIVNVGSVFIFSNIFPYIPGDFCGEVSRFINANGGLLARALFAGLCTGLSSAIAFKFDTSAGGFDIVSYYISLRKSTQTGPYIAAINGFIIATFYLLTGFRGISIPIAGNSYSSWTGAICCVLFSLIYLVETMIIVDLINVRNKKVSVQINTENEDLPRLLLANIPHGATVVKAKGAYSGKDRLLIYITVSSYELKSTISFIKEIDPESFVNVTSLQQVVGRFYIKPIK